MMAITFSLNQEGALFRVKVTDCTDGSVIDKNDISDQKMIFYKPDGTRFEKQATLQTDPLKPAESFVEYQNSIPEISILDDNTSNWEFAAEITLIPGNVVQTSQRKEFWVV